MNLQASTVLKTLSVAALLPAGGCRVGPDHAVPDLPVPPSWVSAPPIPEDAARDRSWWTAFDDPMLTRLVERARASNHSLDAAAARIEEARAAVGIARADLLPNFNADGSASGQRLSARSFEGFPLPPGTSPERDQEIYRAEFDASWELDLFGGNRRRVEAARARLGGAEAAYRAALLSVTAETARVYLELRGARERHRALVHRIEALERLAGLVKDRRESGLATKADLARARADAAEARAGLPLVESEIRLRAYQLAGLTNRTPGEMTVLLGLTKNLPNSASDKARVPLPRWTQPGGRPLAAIRSRPAVAAAERRLAEATAEVGVATARLYPDISLSAALFAEAGALPGLDRAANQGYALTGSILAPLWQGGRLRAQLHAAEAGRDAGVAEFLQTVLDALVDIESALTAYHDARRHYDRRTEAHRAIRESTRSVEELYRSGLSQLIEVSSAQAQEARSAQAVAEARTRLATAAVRVNKALGELEPGQK